VLAARDADVTITVRSIESGVRAQQALTDLARPVRIAIIDLTDRASIGRFIDDWVGPLDVLVNNAGGILPSLERTPEGWEKQFVMNHLGHFELARGLFSALAAGAAHSGDSRIVTLSLSGHLYSPVVFDDIHFRYRQYTDILGHGQAKTANVLFGVGATDRWSSHGIFANAAMPGPTLTGFQRNMDPARACARGWVVPIRDPGSYRRAGKPWTKAPQHLCFSPPHPSYGR
jgi:NAD(P)-dependent dehydrogenase (short-subunit alcohol dehydrogenase family)